MCPQQVDRRGSCKHHMRRGIETRPVITPSTRFRCCRPNSNSVKCSFSSSRQLKATDPHRPGRISGARHGPGWRIRGFLGRAGTVRCGILMVVMMAEGCRQREKKSSKLWRGLPVRARDCGKNTDRREIQLAYPARTIANQPVLAAPRV